MTRAFTTRVAAAVASAAFVVGCRKHVAEHGIEVTTSGSAASGAPSETPPLDHLGPGELPPGTAVAFGLVLPRGMKLFTNFPGKAEAIGPLRPEDVANYVRDRVTASRIELGAVATVFPAVRVKGAEPQKTLRIEVIPLGDRTKVVVRDITPPEGHVAIDPNETDEMRLRKAGYNADGTLVDRLKLK